MLAVQDAPMQSQHPHANQCGAKTRSGEPCRNPAMLSSNRCRMHGGKSLTGAAVPAFRHGRHSKYLPARLTERYEEALSDPELIGLRDDLALMDARLADLLERVDTGESGTIWARLQEAMRDFQRESDPIRQQFLMMAMSQMILDGARDVEAWMEIHVILEQRRKTAESERKRLMDMQQMVTSERVMLLIVAIIDIVRRYVKDPRTLSAIGRDIHELANKRQAGTS